MNLPMKKLGALSISMFAAAAIAIAGCGGGSSSSSSADTAAVAPPDSSVYVNVKARPGEQLSEDVSTLARKLAGVDDLGDEIVSGLDSGADGDICYEKDIEPWLGQNVAFFGKPSGSAAGVGSGDLGSGDFGSADLGAGDFDFGVAADVTDTDKAQAFVDKVTKQEMSGATDGSYDGVDFVTGDGDDGPTTVGLIDDTLVLTSGEAGFKRAVDASKGDSLADEDLYSEVDADSDDSVADLYLNLGELIKQASPDSYKSLSGFYKGIGIDLSDSALSASLVPTSDQIAVEGRTNIASDTASGDATDLISSFPGDSAVAIGEGDLGDNFKRYLDAIDKNGIPGVMPAGELKQQLSESGINVSRALGSIKDVGFFLQGTGGRNISGALALTTSDAKSLKDTLGSLTGLLRLSGTAGVSAIGGDLTGFAVRVPQFGSDRLVVAMKGDRLVVAKGVAAAKQTLSGSGDSLAQDPGYKQAVSALGGNHLSAYVDPSAVLDLLSSSMSKADARQAADVLDKFQFVAAGAADDGKSGEVIAKLAK